MGAIWYKRIELAATVSEVAGCKAGIALNRDQIIQHVPAYADFMLGDDDQMIRIRAEEAEELFGDLLHALGNVHSPGITFPSDSLLRRYRNDPELGPLGPIILQLFLDMFPTLEQRSPPDEPIDLTPFLKEAKHRHGAAGAMLAMEFIDDIEQSIHKKPWVDFRRLTWKNTVELSELFDSENLQSLYGRFFDQRFIDYLYRNFEAIDQINWRQFEGLTCEFFDRAGFQVEIGEGRNDDGIDGRVWMPGETRESPPTILIQCKRQKDKVQKVVVKALWADIVAGNARSGIIVTTSSLSPGAQRVCTARAYPITEADRITVRQWVESMRSPHTGVFMGE